MLRKYKAMLIFLTSMSDEDVEKTLERVRGEIARLGGSAGKTDCIGRRTFARPMRKQEAGVYFEMELTLEPTQVDAFSRRLKLIDEVFRVQVARIEVPPAAAPAATEPVAEPTPVAESEPETTPEPAAEPAPVEPTAEPAPVEAAETPVEPEPAVEPDTAEESKDG